MSCWFQITTNNCSLNSYLMLWTKEIKYDARVVFLLCAMQSAMSMHASPVSWSIWIATEACWWISWLVLSKKMITSAVTPFQIMSPDHGRGAWRRRLRDGWLNEAEKSFSLRWIANVQRMMLFTNWMLTVNFAKPAHGRPFSNRHYSVDSVLNLSSTKHLCSTHRLQLRVAMPQ